RFTVTLFEADLPPRVPLPPGAPGFVNSREIRWEYRAASGEWAPLTLSFDGTYGFSQSGDIIASPPGPPQLYNKFYWIRATLVTGRFEVVPRISTIRVNVIPARQAKQVNEENPNQDQGLGTPDQMIRLLETPLLLDSSVSAGRFEVGEVLDWQQL